MLLWEFLTAPIENETEKSDQKSAIAPRRRRLPYETRCSAITKAGRRCRGRIHKGSELCIFHDPVVAAKRQQRLAAKRRPGNRRLTHLPDGYLRKLSNRRSVGNAMDRLYREVRLGIITPEMGNVMFGILTRIIDSNLISDAPAPGSVDRSKAGRIRPKLSALLTRAERMQWRRAVANAPHDLARRAHAAATLNAPALGRTRKPSDLSQPEELTLQAAS
ncbi:MAG: hypothetical protein IIC01_10775 [Planctomycetes bacterium]|nr:hypothetical protein [Planctomycetota bacterium]